MKISITHIIIDTPFGETVITVDHRGGRIQLSTAKHLPEYIEYIRCNRTEIQQLIKIPLAIPID
jgi:hypothetical protein